VASNVTQRLYLGAAQLQTPAEQEQWYPSEHIMQGFVNNNARFMSSDEVGLCRLTRGNLGWGFRIPTD
jgi:hypothetical protein